MSQSLFSSLRSALLAGAIAGVLGGLVASSASVAHAPAENRQIGSTACSISWCERLLWLRAPLRARPSHSW
jgi:hypothetical protein